MDCKGDKAAKYVNLMQHIGKNQFEIYDRRGFIFPLFEFWSVGIRIILIKRGITKLKRLR